MKVMIHIPTGLFVNDITIIHNTVMETTLYYAYITKNPEVYDFEYGVIDYYTTRKYPMSYGELTQCNINDFEIMEIDDSKLC